MQNYYNEFDPNAAAWLRELIAEGHIPGGWVDQRSIKDIKAHELTGFTQHHFFAGIGGWPLALRIAGWADNRPARTGSCPCQPFSVSGLGGAELDPRHLWPDFRDILPKLPLATALGEQVASKLGREWLARVRADLEGMGYDFGAADLCSAGVRSPNIRQRLYWVADPAGERCAGLDPLLRQGEPERQPGAVPEITRCRLVDRLANANGIARGQGREIGGGCYQGSDAEPRPGLGSSGELEWMDDATGARCAGNGLGGTPPAPRDDAWLQQFAGPSASGFWDNFAIVPCSDGKSRRFEPGSFPLAHGIPGRLGPLLTALRPLGKSVIKAARTNRIARLKGYGNAINPYLAAAFVRSFMETQELCGELDFAESTL